MMIGIRSNLHCRTGGDLAWLIGKNTFGFWFFAFNLSHLTSHALITICAGAGKCMKFKKTKGP